jgi:hypothetical protein
MKISHSKKKITFIIVISVIFITVVVIILLISPIAKYLVEKYDEHYTGRQIRTSWVYVNPFTGYVHISHLKIYESKSGSEKDSIFFSAKGVSANFSLLKLLSKTIEITELTLDQPRGIVIQNKKEFNFNDLIKLFTPEKSDSTPSKVHFNILLIKVKSGEFYYHEKVTPVSYFIKNVNFESTGKRWNADTIAVKFSFLSGPGNGSAKGDLTINFKTLDYRVATIVEKFDLKPIEQYLKDLINYGNFSANLDAEIQATGNLTDEENLNTKGFIVLNDFHFGKNPDEDYASFDKLSLNIIKLNPKEHIYLFDSLSLSHPFFKYENYDYLDNIQTIFGKKGANISAVRSDPAQFNLVLKIADYIKVLSRNFFRSDYKINKVAIYKGCIKYNDYSLSGKFSIEANPFYFIADSVNKDRERVKVSFKSGIQPYGNISVALSINPKDSSDFDMQYHLQRLPASMFNPYLITYTSFPLDRGTIELSGTWKVRNGIIKSENHLLVIDPRVNLRLRNNNTKWIPAPLIMFFIRERGNVIDYEIPITGNLKNPKFHLHDAIFDALGNLFVKPATTNYRMQVKNTENEIEKSLTLKWEMRQNSLLPDQEKFVDKMADFLINSPEASIIIYPVLYAEKEKEYILFFEAKKKYFLLSKSKNTLDLSEGDSLEVDKMSVKDTVFVHYLNKQAGEKMLFTIQDKCNNYVGAEIINAKYKQLNKEREKSFMKNFVKKAVNKRVKVFTTETSIPYNGFSFYKIVYKGEFPEALIKANQQMNDFNHVAPRKRFEKEREKIK